jgi:hypothetical protein
VPLAEAGLSFRSRCKIEIQGGFKVGRGVLIICSDMYYVKKTKDSIWNAVPNDSIF